MTDTIPDISDSETPVVSVPSIPFWYKVGIFLVAAMIWTAISLLLHAPIPFEVAGIVPSLLLSIRSPEIIAGLRSTH